jgi:hypothetical protein
MARIVPPIAAVVHAVPAVPQAGYLAGVYYQRWPSTEGQYMSKGMDRRKEGKKKPTKTLDEKRAAKREKKANRGFRV